MLNGPLLVDGPLPVNHGLFSNEVKTKSPVIETQRLYYDVFVVVSNHTLNKVYMLQEKTGQLWVLVTCLGCVTCLARL